MPSWLNETSTAAKPQSSISARAAATIDDSLSTARLVAAPSSRRFGLISVAPR